MVGEKGWWGGGVVVQGRRGAGVRRGACVCVSDSGTGRRQGDVGVQGDEGCGPGLER